MAKSGPYSIELAREKDERFELARLRTDVDELRRLLRSYAWRNDCPECQARTEMLSESYPLGPGMTSTVVIPTGWTVNHEEGCAVKAALTKGGER